LIDEVNEYLHVTHANHIFVKNVLYR